MTYSVVGMGAIGGYYGGQLANAGREVHFLSHSDYEHVLTASDWKTTCRRSFPGYPSLPAWHSSVRQRSVPAISTTNVTVASIWATIPVLRIGSRHCWTTSSRHSGSRGSYPSKRWPKSCWRQRVVMWCMCWSMTGTGTT